MFHRVKSEAETQVVEKPAPAQSNIRPAQKAKPQTAQSQSSSDSKRVQPSSAQKPKAQNTQPQKPQEKKEASSMNQPEKVQDDNFESQNEVPGSAYQRVGTAPASVAGKGYPGTASGYTSYNAPAAGATPAGDRRLTIGAGITMSGEIESCDYLLVEGTVEAALKGANVLDVAETGVFYGTVDIEDATIAGRFEGDITARGRLVLRSGATVTGTIAYKELEIEAGAIIDGKLTPLTAVEKAAVSAPVAPPKEAKPAPAPAQKAEKAAEPKEKATPKAANNEGGLFSKAATAAE